MTTDDESSIEPHSTPQTEHEQTVLEQWKFFAQTTMDVSNRRLKNNRFYLRLLIALLGAAGLGSKLGYVTASGLLVIGVIGLPFCVLWSFHILSYKQLNSGKYRVLWEMADGLPFDPFQREWDALKQGEEPHAYIKHTTVEVWWPRVFGYFYAALAIYGGLTLANRTPLIFPLLGLLTIIWLGYAVMVLRGRSPSQRYWDYTGE